LLINIHTSGVDPGGESREGPGAIATPQIKKNTGGNMTGSMSISLQIKLPSPNKWIYELKPLI